MFKSKMRGESFASTLVGYLIVFVIIGFIALAVGCTDEKSANKALTNEGYTDIKIEGWAGPFQCGDDWNATEFTAKNSQGKTVNGTVCSGLLFKNATIRW